MCSIRLLAQIRVTKVPRRSVVINGFQSVAFGQGGAPISCSVFQYAFCFQPFKAFESFYPVCRQFLKRARTRSYITSHRIYFKLVSYLLLSFQIWLFQIRKIMRIGQSKHMRGTRFFMSFWYENTDLPRELESRPNASLYATLQPLKLTQQ